jgi:hypothetical protein
MSSVDFLTVGRGPGLVVIPGSTRRAHHYRAVAEALSDVYTVHVVNRRGRGGSPPQGPGTRYGAITAPTLLLGGGRSPAYIRRALLLLDGIIPQAKLIMTPEFDHNAPDLGAPSAVAELIRA